MQETRVETGEIIYRESDPGEALYVLTEGEVEVVRTVGGSEVRLAILSKGAIFGEMAVIRDQPHSTTVRVVKDASMITVPKDAFLGPIQQDHPLALTLMRTLCERLTRADDRLIKHQIFTESARLVDIGPMRLHPASPEMEKQIGTDGVTIDKLPYHVGRHARPGDATTVKASDLVIRAPAGAQIAPMHFVLEDHAGRLTVRDLDSKLGTIVNDRRLAQFEQTQTAELNFGENVVQAGGEESPYRFRIIVERTDG